MKLAVIIPALNEEATVGRIVSQIQDSAPERCTVRIVVADNGSVDDTARVARRAGAEVVSVPERGYGAACLAAVTHLDRWPDLLLFIDADGSSRAEEIPLLIEAIQRRRADLVIGRREDRRHMTLPQRFGTHLAILLVNLLWGSAYRDMGPFRVIRREAFERLGMQDRTWGWTIEMQILAAEKELAVVEIPVGWAAREGGTSKISGSVSGVLRAGARILWTVGSYAVSRRNR